MSAATDASAMSLMRNLGRFIGHVVAGVRSDPASARGAAPREVHRTVSEESRPDGVVLRRTVIEEVEVPAPRESEAKNDHAP